MRRTEIRCRICVKIVKKKKNRIGADSLWYLYQNFQIKKGCSYSDEDKQEYCCQDCYMTVSLTCIWLKFEVILLLFRFGIN